jgi:hypothetical protein
MRWLVVCFIVLVVFSSTLDAQQPVKQKITINIYIGGNSTPKVQPPTPPVSPKLDAKIQPSLIVQKPKKLADTFFTSGSARLGTVEPAPKLVQNQKLKSKVIDPVFGDSSK